MTQFAVLKIGSGTYRVRNDADRIAQVRQLVAKPPRTLSGAELFKRQYSEQTRTNATPAERTRIMAELTASGRYQEIQPIQEQQTMTTEPAITRALAVLHKETGITPQPEVVAHCGADIAAWIDPSGALQTAGLLKISPAPVKPPKQRIAKPVESFPPAVETIKTAFSLRAIIDEVKRRHPPGFAQWIEAANNRAHQLQA